MPTYIWCRDKDTGHCFDVDADDPRLYEADSPFEVVKDYPENSSPTAIQRAPKHRVALPPAEKKTETKPQAGTTATAKKE